MDMKRLWLALNMPRTLPALLAYRFSPQKNIIQQDVVRWVEVLKLANFQYPVWIYFHYLLLFYPEFRNLFYWRIKQNSLLLSKLLEVFYFRLGTLYITGAEQIGPGLFLQHGFSTFIAAKTIGRNCWINQEVTIGYTKSFDPPTIGDNVRIAAGAKVLGRITIGDNVFIGANAVVIRDVPPNCTVGGVPARIIRRNGVLVSSEQ